MTDYPELSLKLGHHRVPAPERDSAAVLNPVDESELGRYPIATHADIDSALAVAQTGFDHWKAVSPNDRSALLRKTADLLRKKLNDIAPLITREVGIPLAYAQGEVLWAANILDWCAEEARRLCGRTIPANEPNLTQTVYRLPIGPVAAFTPWNAPVLMPARKIGEALAAGCSVVLKPAEKTPASAMALVDLFIEAGLPEECLSVVTGAPAMISQALIASPVIKKISFTGSVAVGRQLAATAGAHGKPITLELGGHAPVLVCKDADIEAAASGLALMKSWNSGQLCGSPTRILVHRSVYDAFKKTFLAALQNVKVGDGLLDGVAMGPLTSSQRVASMSSMVENAKSFGASIDQPGFTDLPQGSCFYPLTVISQCPKQARIWNEEPFGPLCVLAPFDSLDEAIVEANRLDFGLAAYAFTQCAHTINRLTSEVACGQLGINTFSIVNPEVPFGGVNDSGYGKEGGSEGVSAYLVSKMVACNYA